MQNERKEATIKLFAIIGLIASVSVLLWLVAEGVRMAPQAFSSVANTFSALNQEDLVLSSEESVINSDDAFGIAWSPIRENVSYSLSYSCAEGVSLEARSGENAQAFSCEETFALNNNGIASIILTGEKNRFSDVVLIITETNTETGETRQAETVVTVVNREIPLSVSLDEDRDEVDAEPIVTPSTPTEALQISDPNGTSDLSVTYIGTGVYSDTTGVFTSASLDTDVRGSVQFAVANLGNKTSEPWSFTADLPTNPKVEYESTLQESLRPGERTVLTLSFGDVAEAGTHDFSVELNTSDDSNINNNEFSVTVTVTD